MRMLGEWKDCYAGIKGVNLHVGNARLERVWDLSSGTPITVSILDKRTGEEWIEPSSRLPMFRLACLGDTGGAEWIKAACMKGDDAGLSAPYLSVAVDFHYSSAQRTVRCLTRLYPDSAFMRHELLVLASSSVPISETADGPQVIWPPASNETVASRVPVPGSPDYRLDDNNKQRAAAPPDYVDAMELAELHCRWETVSFRDVTDTNNNLVSTDKGLLYPNERRSLRGNIALLSRTVRPGGLIALKEGPTPLAHLQDMGEDYRFSGRRLFTSGSGLSADDLQPEEWMHAYGSAIAVFGGSRYGAYAALHDYHRAIYRYQPDRDYYIMSNTWGDRSRDGRVTETFLEQELLAAARLGIDIYQIDDGWQKGATANSVVAGGRWSDYYEEGSDFWSVHPDRFPRGLKPVSELADSLGVRLGLWFSPDSSQDFAHWEKDAAVILDLHRKYGICYFKLDGVNLASKRGETRFVRMMRTVVEATGGRVTFNLDATSQVRLGYFGRNQFGTLFLENRYTDWGNYYPHWTLRNLWSLAPYVPAQKLQLEFLNVYRNAELYQGDPLAPGASGLLYAFAAALFANPLAWMELTGLPSAPFEQLRLAIQDVKPYHSDLLSGHIVPIGEEPTGTGWTGMQSIVSDRSGYLLIIRERHPSETCSYELFVPGLASGPDAGGSSQPYGELLCTPLLQMDERDRLVRPRPEGAAFAPLQLRPDERGAYTFTRPAPFTFALYHYAFYS
ncbi:Melibiase [Paenibacillus sp. UNCCL117]|uniref:alpha-galactosidase n=1 Tax=unclassified Paenibacillus TaxID=185978 RepID=UPI0008877C46|nr:MULTISPECIES: alpha-galactosidase [unclassified Paenibacillus]SDE37082.1 Melibiase [Paenibacillus sp. cl123]SFW64879.1 Melibiase [Paenibacillus sp. UNCCL117]